MKSRHVLLVAALPILALAGCAVAPTGPTAMALPGTGKNFEQFRADDMDCRQYAQYQTGGKSADQAAVDAAQSSAYGSQRQYDNAYIQCMYAKGHQVPVPQGQFRSGRYSSGAPATGSYAPPPPPDAPPPR